MAHRLVYEISPTEKKLYKSLDLSKSEYVKAVKETLEEEMKGMTLEEILEDPRWDSDVYMEDDEGEEK
jgi:hypothetical protein